MSKKISIFLIFSLLFLFLSLFFSFFHKEEMVVYEEKEDYNNYQEKKKDDDEESEQLSKIDFFCYCLKIFGGGGFNSYSFWIITYFY